MPSPKFSKCRVLVTGAAGFLGSHLVDRLLQDGCDVIGLDSLQTGYLGNIAHLTSNSNFRFIEQDIVVPFDIDVDLIYNLACPASPIHYQTDPIGTFKTSVIGTLNLLDMAHRRKAVFFQASTSEVYGDPLQHPQQEDYWGHVNPIGVRSCYDEGKRGAETVCFDFHRKHSVNIKVARIFNTYGPRMHPDDGRVVSNFIMQALRNEPITIYGNGSQTRSFCFVDDLISGFVKFAATPPDVIGPINLGNPKEFNMLELAETVIQLTGSRSQVAFETLPEDDPRQRCPDISKARELLTWEPKVELREGLQKTIDYFRRLPS